MGEGQPGFASTLWDVTRLRDLALLVIPPAILLAVFSLPVETRRAYTFSYTEPGFVSAVTANFIHFSQGHLLGSIAGYLLLVSVGYALAVLAGHRRLFGVAIAVYILGFPPVLSVLNLAVPREAVTYGFSGINMALAGLLAPLLIIYAQRRLQQNVTVRDSPALFLLGMAVIAIVSVPTSMITWGIALAAILGALLYRFPTPARLRSIYDCMWSPELAAREVGWFDLFLVGAVIYGMFLLVGFPSKPQSGGTVLNSYVHLLGFSLGFLVPYIALELGLFDSDLEYA